MQKYLTQMLDEINKDPKSIAQFKDNFLLKVIFAHSFLPNYKFQLPEGEPPFKPAPQPMGMTDTNLFAECKKFHGIFCDSKLKPVKRESLYIGLIEGIHPDEVKVMNAVKDQKLHKMYPKITWKLVSEAGFIPAPPEKEKKSEKDA